MCFHPAQQLGGLEGLGDIVHGAQIKPLHDMLGLRLGREEHDGNVPGGRIGLEATTDLEPIIRSIISKISRPGEELAQPDELFNVGVIAALQALDQFDPAINMRFITFAYPRIRGEIIDFLRRLDPLPRRRRAKVAHERDVTHHLAQVQGDEPCETAVAEAMHVSVSELRVIRCDATRRFVDSLDVVRDVENGLRLVDMIEDVDAREGFEQMDWEDIRAHLDAAAHLLDERDRMILELYFGESLTLAEIGSLLAISEARVSQLRRAALDRLARAVEPSLRWAA